MLEPCPLIKMMRFETVVNEASSDVVHEVEKSGCPQRDGASALADAIHVLRGIACPDGRSVQHADLL